MNALGLQQAEVFKAKLVASRLPFQSEVGITETRIHESRALFHKHFSGRAGRCETLAGLRFCSDPEPQCLTKP